MAQARLLVLLTTALLFSAALVATADAKGKHKRINQIDKRLEKQQGRITGGVKNGQINAKQELKDEKKDAKAAQQLSKDEA